MLQLFKSSVETGNIVLCEETGYGFRVFTLSSISLEEHIITQRMDLNPEGEEYEMRLQKAARCESHSGRCALASTSFPEMMVSFSEREMVMTVYKRNRLLSETS